MKPALSHTFILCSILLFLASCSKYYGCDEEMECSQKRPEKGWVEISFGPSEETDSLGIEIRNDVWEKGRTVHSGEVSGRQFLIELPVQKRYTAELTYASSQDTLFAYDSGRLDVEEEKNCEELCYKLDTLRLDLRRADR